MRKPAAPRRICIATVHSAAAMYPVATARRTEDWTDYHRDRRGAPGNSNYTVRTALLPRLNLIPARARLAPAAINVNNSTT